MVNKITSIKERVLQIAENQTETKKIFFEKIGMSSANFRGKALLSPLNSSTVENIITLFPEINIQWLLTGKGAMTGNLTDATAQYHAGEIEGKLSQEIDEWKRKYYELLEKYNNCLESETLHLKKFELNDPNKTYSPKQQQK